MLIWYMNIKDFMYMDMIDKYKRNLSRYRIEKIDRCHLIKNKAQSLCAGYILSEMLKLYGIDEKEIDYIENEHGKPYIKGYENIFFSISHSENMVAVISDDTECGIDVEYVKPYSEAVVKRVFNEEDSFKLEHAVKKDYNEACFIFSEIWTRKEAIGKLTGAGLDFSDECQKRESDELYLEKNGFYGITVRVEDEYVISAFSKNPDIKCVIPVRRQPDKL